LSVPNQREYSEIRMDGVTYGVANFDTSFKAQSRLAQYSYCYLVRKGQFILELEHPGTHEVIIPEGAIFSISGLTPHTIRSIGSPGGETLVLNDCIDSVGRQVPGDVQVIIGEVKNDALAFASAYSGLQLITPKNAPDIHNRLWQLYALIEDELLRQSPNAEIVVRLLSEAIVVDLGRFAALEKTDQSVPANALIDRRILRVMMAIGIDPGHKWTVAELASLADMSRTAFATAFRKHLGTTPLKSVSRARLAKSIFELDKTTRSVDQIAENCGFGSSSAFIRAFQKEFRATPSKWRRKIGQ